MKQIRPELTGYTLHEIDGIHLSDETGWALIRPSNTEACISVRIEAKNTDRLQHFAQTINRILRDAGVETQDLQTFL